MKSSFLIHQRKNSKPSSGEKIVIEILRKKKIKFKREHFHPDLINDETGHLLFFDFYISKLNLVIEVDGPHHHAVIDGKMDEFTSQVHKDGLKDIFCEERGIKMLRLNYEDLKHPMTKLVNVLGEINGVKSHRHRKKKRERLKERPPKRKKSRIRKVKGQHPEKNMNKLKQKIQNSEAEIQKRREEARLNYPADIRIYLAEKNNPNAVN